MAEEKAPISERRGLPRLLWGMVVRPRATLEYLREQGGRTWWVPVLLAVLLVILPIVVAAPITARQTREVILATQEQREEQFGAGMSAEERAQMEEQIMARAASPLITVVFPAVAGVVGLIVGWLAWAGALHLAGTALGGRSTFGQMFRMVVWAWLPYTLRGLLQTIYILISGQLIANPGLSGFVRDSRPIGEMVVAPPSAGQIVLTTLLSKVDLFLAWNLILLVIGMIATTRLPRRKAVLVTLGVWILLTAVGLLPTFVSGLFAQQMGMGAAP